MAVTPKSALTLLQQGEYEKSRLAYRTLIDTQSPNADYFHYYGLLSMMSGHFADGLAYMTLATSLNNSDKTFIANNVQAINIALANKDNAKIDTLLNAFVCASNNNRVMLMQQARFYLMQKQGSKCLQALAKLDNEKTFNDYFYAAIANKLMKQQTPAQDMLQQALTHQPLHQLYDEKTSTNKPSLLLLYACEQLDFSAFIDQKDISFSINGGHFNVHTFVNAKSYNLSRLFVSDSDSFREVVKALPNYDVIINCIADAETSSNALVQVSTHFGHLKLMNGAAQVLNSSRINVFEKIKDVDNLLMPAADVITFTDNLESNRRLLNNQEFPFLIRPLGSSTGIGLVKITQQAEFDDLHSKIIGKTMNICSFVDFRCPDSYYRKYRVFVINGQIFPAHAIASPHWNIHSSSRYEIMKDNDVLQQQEMKFLTDISSVLTTEHLKAINEISRRLDLEYFGIDFAILDDQRLLIFEANAGMHANLNYIKDFPYHEAAIKDIITAFRAMIKN
ncbi:MAG: hypothetical protein HRU25_10060 [Psychrobium sp.]|nr:hypothetical protein [Psychrobium sp.]